MIVNVALEHRFHRLPDGTVWTQTQCAYPFWTRYLDVFDQARAIARIQDVPDLEGQWHRADGPGVTFVPVPYYLGPTDFLRKALPVRRAIRSALGDGEAAILRVPGTIGGVAYGKLKRHPFGVEVVGDPYDALASGVMNHPLLPIIRWQMTQQLKRLCRDACAASYVTARALQRRYPSTAYTIAASSIDLKDEAFARAPRTFTGPARRLVFVGSLEHYQKAPDVLAQAFAECRGAGLDLTLTMVGDGRRRGEVEALMSQLGCRDHVTFAGQLRSSEVASVLDQGDLFVLPSRQEGLPRAMIEAMARGLPCIGSEVAGIPELLLPEDLVVSGDAAGLAAKIREMASDPGRLTRTSARNLEEARSYRAEELQRRRIGFYRHVRQETESWLRGRAPRTGATDARS